MKPFSLPTFSETDELVADAAASPWSMPLNAAQHAVAAGGAGLDALLEAAATSALAIVPAASGAVIALGGPGGALLCRAASGDVADWIGRPYPADPLALRCLAEARPHHCDDAAHDGRVDQAACRRLGIAATILVPIPCAGAIAGLIAVHAPLPNAFSARDRLSVQLLAGTVALGLAAAPPSAAADPRLAAGFEAAAAGLAFVAPGGAILAANARFCSLSGRKRDSLLRANLRDLLPAAELDEQAGLVEALLAGTIGHFDMATASGLQLAVSLARDASGAPDFLVLAAAEAPQPREARYDPLTGLLNAGGLSDRLARELDRAANDGRPLCLALLQLDGLAALGLGETERCLEAVARALDRACRPGDAVGRIGDGLFALVMPGLQRSAAATPLRRARAAVARLARSEGWSVAARLGAASRLRDGATPQSLIAAAEARLGSSDAR